MVANYKKGSLELMILALLESGPMYGYQISLTLIEKSDGVINVPEGSLYPVLYRLLEKQYITDEQKLVGKRMRRIYYHITPAGRTRFAELQQEYFKVHEAIQKILDKHYTIGGTADNE